MNRDVVVIDGKENEHPPVLQPGQISTQENVQYSKRLNKVVKWQKKKCRSTAIVRLRSCA